MSSESGWRKLASGCQHRLLVGKWYDYLVLVLLAFVPWVVAGLDHALLSHPVSQVAACPPRCPADSTAPCATDRAAQSAEHSATQSAQGSVRVDAATIDFPSYVSVGSSKDGCVAAQPTVFVGYLHRWNWSWLIFELPLALYALRYTTKRLFDPRDDPHARVIPDLIDPPSAKRSRAALFEVATNPWNFIVALVLDVLLHLVDLQPLFSLYLDALWPGLRNCLPAFLRFFISPKENISIWDWTAWFLAKPDRANILKNLLLVVVAYPCQFLMVLFAMSLLVLLFRHNSYLLGSIYVRSRRGNQDPADFIRLNFDDPERRMGLGPLGSRFNAQMIVLIVAGALTLASRYMNANIEPVRCYVLSIDYGDFVNPPKVLLEPPYHGSDLFPDAGQVLFAVVWLIMFVIVMMPAWVKCLPLRLPWPAWIRRMLRQGPRRGPGVEAFLREFFPPDQWVDKVRTDADITQCAEKFACQSFWPVGDASAQALSIVCFFMFAIILVPIPPLHIKQDLYLLEVLIVAYTISKSLFWVFGYLLAIVDNRLISKS